MGAARFLQRPHGWPAAAPLQVSLTLPLANASRTERHGGPLDMRVLLVEDDSATAQSIELMLKVDSFNVYTTDLGEEGTDLGKIYDYDQPHLDTSWDCIRAAA